MASNDLWLRSDADKGESSPDEDLRLRSDADKEISPAGAEVKISNLPARLVENGLI